MAIVNKPQNLKLTSTLINRMIPDMFGKNIFPPDTSETKCPKNNEMC